MALSKRQADQVAQEKERAALAGGDSRGKAKQYAEEVREAERLRRLQEKGGKR
jgi:hypothetical protein